MKNISQNVWQKNLDDDDWNFLQVQNDEWPECLRWELYREKAQVENRGDFPSELIRVPARGEDARIMRLRLATGKPAGVLSKQDWTSYLSYRKKRLWKPLPKEDNDRTLWISTDWHTVHRHWGDELEYACAHIPSPPIMDGDGETEILPFKIPWGWRDDEILEAFAQWLKQNRPRGEKGVYEICGKKFHWSDDRPRMDEPAKPKKKGGAGSYVRQVKTLLKQLAAWRLIQRYNGNRIKAYCSSRRC